jgi:hypothetical protein
MTKQESKLWIKVYTEALKVYNYDSPAARAEADEAVRCYRVSITKLGKQNKSI